MTTLVDDVENAAAAALDVPDEEGAPAGPLILFNFDGTALALARNEDGISLVIKSADVAINLDPGAAVDLARALDLLADLGDD